MTATFHVGDAIEVMSKLPEKSVDLVLTSPPFLALRSYLPSDHPDKALEGGSQSTPGEFIDWLVDVVEACDRVLAPHGSLCIELGDTYAGSGGAGGDYNADGLREGQPRFRQGPDKKWDAGSEIARINGAPGGTGWPLAKSLSLIPELFRLTLVYGTNPLTGRQTERWRLRNVVRWVRPNPPVGALGDKFRPATSELMVFCKSAKRYFDLDAVRSPHTEPGAERQLGGRKSPNGGDWTRGEASGQNPAGAPPLDWWNVPLEEGGTPTRYGPKPPSPKTRGVVKAATADPSVLSSNQSNGPDNPAGAPPLDWWNIPLLEGEEETRYGPKAPKPSGGPTGFGAWDSDKDKSGVKRRVENTIAHELGAPPLDWWNIPPGGYEGAHYAVWPKELLVKPIKAMCPSLVCLECGPIYDVRNLSESGTSEKQAVLLEDVRPGVRPVHSGAVQGVHNSPGIHHGEQYEGSSDGDSRGVHLPASASDGRTLRADAPTDRSRSPQERNQERQPDREPRSHGSGSALRPRDDGSPAEDDALPSLRRPSEFLRDCPRCGGPTRVGRVLDPFGGSGTTALVATGHGRDCILIDLDERNYDLALQRVGPFILSRADSV